MQSTLCPRIPRPLALRTSNLTLVSFTKTPQSAFSRLHCPRTVLDRRYIWVRSCCRRMPRRCCIVRLLVPFHFLVLYLRRRIHGPGYTTYSKASISADPFRLFALASHLEFRDRQICTIEHRLLIFKATKPMPSIFYKIHFDIRTSQK